MDRNQLSDDPMSDLESDCGSDRSESALFPKIPKPQGEVGRPGRGGYALSDVLDWDKDTLKKFKV